MKLRKTLLAASIAAISFTGAAALANPLMMGAPVAVSSPQQAASLVAKLASDNGRKGLDADHSYKISAEHPGVAGTKVTRLKHTYKGVRVFQSESVIVTDDAGTIVSEVDSDRRQHLGAGKANALGATKAFDVNPKISAQAAIDAVVKAVAPNGVHRNAPDAELIIYPIITTERVATAKNKAESELNALDVEDKVTGYELAYLVKTRMVSGGKLVFRDTIVSANDGRTLTQWNALQTVVGVGNSQYNGTVPIQTTLSGSTYKMLDPTRGTGGTFGGAAITNANHSSQSNPQAGLVYTNSTNTWGDGQQYISGGSTTNANGQTAAVNALWGLMNTYDGMKNTQGWQSLNGQNTATYIAVHVDNNYDNAFFDPSCSCMFIGDGGSYFNSLGSIDVIGHEMGHGVTDATSNLTYSGESGGLNESSSDINGEMIEAYAKAGGTGTVIPATGNDWMMGKEIAKNGQPLRWMWKPSKDGASKDAWTSTLGSLDPHYSSGPNNRMFYFLSQGSNATTTSEMYSPYLTQNPKNMTGIGNDKAFKIWFRTNTTKLTASSNYADARAKMIQAATELYGAGSKEVTAVTRAYAAINVGADVPEAGGALGISSQPQSVTVAPGSTASFSVTAAGGTAPYKYQWLRNGANITGATAASYSLTAQTTDNGAQFSVKVTDSAATPVTVTSSAATLTVGTVVPTERVVNGSFESGTTGWSGTTGVIGTWTQQAAYDGTRYAYLGGNGTTTTETITQAVTIPSTATSANLTFALHIDTAETTTTTAYDKLVVTVKNSAGTVLGTLATYSNLNKATGFSIKSFNLLPYKGQTVTLSYAMNEDSTLQTSFVVDKVSLITQ